MTKKVKKKKKRSLLTVQSHVPFYDNYKEAYAIFFRLDDKIILKKCPASV